MGGGAFLREISIQSWLACKLGMLVSFINGHIFIDVNKNNPPSVCLFVEVHSTHEVSNGSSFGSKSKYEAASAEPVEWIKAKANQIEP